MDRLLYPAIFHAEDDGGYSVTIPDIEGCYSEGDTLIEAYDMAFDAVGLCLE
ncbi:MAG: type II toxin-antitoxin system HicB family antitoxin, partial [Clostridia bacterium]